MTPQDAIPILKRLQEPEAWEPQITFDAFDALELAIEALEKQIPKSMMEEMEISGRPIRVCGNCEDAPGNGDFCRWCGQRIDFGGDAE